MNTEELTRHAKALRERIQSYARDGQEFGALGDGAQAQVCEFLRQYAGPKSAFTRQAEAAKGFNSYRVSTLSAILGSYIEFPQAGLAGEVSPERKAKLDVVSDILSQAQAILDNKGYHPAAAAVLTGASLEEFLRTWVEHAGVDIKGAKVGIDVYAGALRAQEFITKQDVKDINAWAGIRNHAAHGDWDEVSDRQRIKLMLEGVNLFMRQNTQK